MFLETHNKLLPVRGPYAWWTLVVCLCLFPLADGHGASPLADAVESQDRNAIENILPTADGESLNQSQADGMTALHWAVHWQWPDLALRLLERGAVVEAKTRYGITPLWIACQRGDEAMVNILLSHGASVTPVLKGGETLLMTAARTGKPGCLQQLLDHGADVDTSESHGQTALMWAAAEGHQQAVRLLLSAGADPNKRLASGFNAIFFAVREGQLAVVRLLLDAGQDIHQTIQPDKATARGPNAGMGLLAMAVENGHFDLAAMLLDAGADPNDQRSGFAALHRLAWVRKPNRGDDASGLPAPQGSGRLTTLQFVERLCQAGADVNLRLEKGGVGKGKVTLRGATPVFMAADTADLPFLKLLVELGGDPHIPNADGSTPLMMAAGLGTNAPAEEAGSEEESLAVVEWLLALGAELNTVDEQGNTAMHGAAFKNFPLMIDLLDQRGADIQRWNRPNQLRLTPLHIAQGYRPGNFRPSPTTVAALHEVMRRHGVDPPPDRGDPRTDASY
jgi:ankyrin repeat protein